LQVEESTRYDHLRTLSANFDHRRGAFRAGVDRIVHESINPSGQREVTFMEFGDTQHYQALVDEIRQLSAVHGDLVNVKVFNARDGTLCFNVYTFDDALHARFRDTSAQPAADLISPEGCGPDAIFAFARELEDAHCSGRPLPAGMQWSQHYTHQALTEFMRKCTAKHVAYARPRSFLRQIDLFQQARRRANAAPRASFCATPVQVRGTEDVAVHIERTRPEDSSLGGGALQYWIRIAETNDLPQVGREPLRASQWCSPVTVPCRTRSSASRACWPCFKPASCASIACTWT
jgi:hypothetical protein